MSASVPVVRLRIPIRTESAKATQRSDERDYASARFGDDLPYIASTAALVTRNVPGEVCDPTTGLR